MHTDSGRRCTVQHHDHLGNPAPACIICARCQREIRPDALDRACLEETMLCGHARKYLRGSQIDAYWYEGDELRTMWCVECDRLAYQRMSENGESRARPG